MHRDAPRVAASAAETAEIYQDTAEILSIFDSQQTPAVGLSNAAEKRLGPRQAEMGPLKISREELYRKVWKTTLGKLVAELGTTHVEMISVCEELNVPRPERSFWSRRHLGLPVEVIPLPPPESGMQLDGNFRRKGEPRPNRTTSDLATAPSPENVIKPVEPAQVGTSIPGPPLGSEIASSPVESPTIRATEPADLTSNVQQMHPSSKPLEAWQEGWLGWGRDWIKSMNPLTNGYLEKWKEEFDELRELQAFVERLKIESPELFLKKTPRCPVMRSIKKLARQRWALLILMETVTICYQTANRPLTPVAKRGRLEYFSEL